MRPAPFPDITLCWLRNKVPWSKSLFLFCTQLFWLQSLFALVSLDTCFSIMNTYSQMLLWKPKHGIYVFVFICNVLIGGSERCSAYNWNVFSVITYITFVHRFAATCTIIRQSCQKVLCCKRKEQVQVINFREKGALMRCVCVWGGVAREDWVSTGNETAPLPAFSTATPKTKIASCVTNEPTLTYPPDLWQSVLPPSSTAGGARDGTGTDNSWFLFLHERNAKNKKMAEVGGRLLLTATPSPPQMVAVKRLNGAQKATVQLVSGHFVCELSLWSLSSLITNINIDDLLGEPKWGACPSGSGATMERSSLCSRRTGEYDTQQRDSGRFNEHYRIPAPFCPLFNISEAPALILRPATVARKEHKQLAETSRVDYVPNQSNQRAVVKRASFTMPVRKEARLSGPDSLNKMTEFIKYCC